MCMNCIPLKNVQNISDPFWKIVMQKTLDFCNEPCPMCGAKEYVSRLVTSENVEEFALPALINYKLFTIVYDDTNDRLLFGSTFHCRSCKVEFLYLCNDSANDFSIYDKKEFYKPHIFNQCKEGELVFMNLLIYSLGDIRRFNIGKITKEQLIEETEWVRRYMRNEPNEEFE